ncbi:MAG: cytochrome c oxidase assembly protein [Candidatus Binatia bacterium]
MNPVSIALLHSWSCGPWLIASLVIAGSLYLCGWRTLHRRAPHRFGVGRLVAFQAGLLVLFLALASPLHALAEKLLVAHMLQHLLVMMVVPPLIWLGAPLAPLLQGLPSWVVQRWVGPVLAWPGVRRVGSAFTHPLTCWSTFIVSTLAWHTPTLYERALHSELWHEIQHLSFLGTALLFWWPVIQPWPSRPRWPRWTMIPYLFLADVQNTALSAFLMFSERILYPTYATDPRLWGISALNDQIAAGAIMWVPGSALFLIAVAVLVVRVLDAPLTRGAIRSMRDTPATGNAAAARA